MQRGTPPPAHLVEPELHPDNDILLDLFELVEDQEIMVGKEKTLNLGTVAAVLEQVGVKRGIDLDFTLRAMKLIYKAKNGRGGTFVNR